MFHNKMTEKMPCWKCKKYKDGCEVHQSFMDSFAPTGIRRRAENHISGLTFDCDLYKE